MTEAQWLAWPEPDRMLRFVDAAWTARKLRLVGVACFRAAWGGSPTPEMADAVATIEAFADDSAVESEVLAAVAEAQLTPSQGRRQGRRASPAWAHNQRRLASALGRLGWSCTSNAVAADIRHVLHTLAPHDATRRAGQAASIRDVAGNPFRPVTFSPAWRTADAVGLAAAIYAGRAFHDLPILADALEDAGCDAAELLGHLRGPGPHARGCWALDLVLGRG